MNTPTKEQIEKLPKWAQEHIATLERQRSTAIESLNEYRDQQSPSPFYLDEMLCTGEQAAPSRKKIYVQAHSICVEWRGVLLRVDANDYGNTREGIRLQWSTPNQSLDEIAFVPTSYQSARLVSKQDMR